MSMKDYALKYALQGFKVFPLVAGQKIPATAHGFKDATLDTDQIADWWTKMPNANIGISCDSGICVIDVDMHGSDGKQSIEKWQEEHGNLGSTLTVKTANNGIHYYFFNTLKVKNAVNVLPGVDLRAEGGYVVAPPSVLADGRTYEWLDDVNISRPTLSAAELMKLPSRAMTGAKTGGNGAQGTFKRIKVAEGSGRNSYLNQYCGYACKSHPDATQNDIETMIRLINDEDCQPPLDEKELQRSIFKSIGRYLATSKAEAEESKKEMIQPITEWPVEDVDDSLADVDEIPTRWLVNHYIPESSYTLLVGDGGVGKTTIWCSIAASVSNGTKTFLDCKGHANMHHDYDSNIVCFLSAEDSVPRVLKRRLREANANVNNIHCIDMDNEHFSEFWIGSKRFEQWIERWKPALCVLDPIQSFIDPTTDMSKRNSMRHALRPLSQLGSKYGTSFLVVVHTNKSQTAWGRARMADSSDIWDQARSVLMVGHANDDANNLYISHEKSNYGQAGQTVLFGNANGVIFNNGTSDLKDKDFVALNFKTNKASRESTTKEDATQIILDILDEYPDGIASTDLKKEVTEEWFVSEYMFNSVMAELKKKGLIVRQQQGFRGVKIIKKCSVHQTKT